MAFIDFSKDVESSFKGFVKQPRLGIMGISGGGKTLTGAIAGYAFAQRWRDLKTFGPNIYLFDTERGSSANYHTEGGTDLSDPDDMRINFEGHIIDKPYRLTDMTRTIESLAANAERLKLGAVVIDSLSHFWMGEGGALEESHQIAKAKYKGDTFRAWGDITPKVNALINATIALPVPLVVTVRSKHAYERTETVKAGRTKTQIMRMGDAPVFRNDLLYEYDVFGMMVPDGRDVNFVVEKSRFSAWAGRVETNPNVDFFNEYVDWAISDGSTAQESGYIYGNGKIVLPTSKGYSKQVGLFNLYRAANNDEAPDSPEQLKQWAKSQGAKAAANAS